MTEQQIRSIVKFLNSIPWHTATEVTSEAEMHIRQHILRMHAVFDQLQQKRKKSPIDAYSNAQSAGHAAEGYGEFWDALYDDVDYRETPSKMPIVLSLASHYFWDQDPDLGQLEDPWEPVLKLFEMGYTSTFDQDDFTGALDFVLEYSGGKKSYPLVGTGVVEP